MTILTTADLRKTLLAAIEKVESGAMDGKEARDIAILADKVIQLSLLELKYSETLSRLDKEGQGISPGPLLLSDKRKGDL